MSELALARLSLLKSDAYLKESKTDFDDEFKSCLVGASFVANMFTSRELRATIYEAEYHTGDGGFKLYLKQWPVTTVHSVHIWDGSDSYDLETATYYALFEERYLRYPALGVTASTYGSWPEYANGIKVSYTAGYDCSRWDNAEITDSFDVPAELEMAVAMIAEHIWLGGKGGGARRGIMSASVGPESLGYQKYAQGLPDEALDILKRYRRVII